MANDMNDSYEYPFEMADEAEIRFGENAIDGRPAGVPGSYDEGGSTRWTPDAIAEVHALAQLGRYQVRGYNTFNKRMPTFDDLTFVPATMTRLPLEGYRENCETKTVLGAGVVWWRNRWSSRFRCISRRCRLVRYRQTPKPRWGTAPPRSAP